MRFTALFEAWHIGDGNYPPLSRGQLVNLSFELGPHAPPEIAHSDLVPQFQHIRDAEYDFVAKVIRNYTRVGGDSLAVLDSGALSFYIASPMAAGFESGMTLRGSGTLLLDHYAWVENVDAYLDPPDLFYTLRVTRVRKVRIPDRFVMRGAKGKSFPTRVLPSELDVADYEELETMLGQTFDEEFYLIGFETVEGESVPRTFL